MYISRTVTYRSELTPESIQTELNAVSHKRFKIQSASVDKAMFFVFNKPITTEAFHLIMKHPYQKGMPTKIVPQLHGSITKNDTGSTLSIRYQVDAISKIYLFIPFGICIGAFFTPFILPLILLGICSFFPFFGLISWGFKIKEAVCETYIKELLKLKIEEEP